MVEYLNSTNLIRVGKIVMFFEKSSETYCILEMINRKKIEYSGEEDIEILIELNDIFLFLKKVIKLKLFN